MLVQTHQARSVKKVSFLSLVLGDTSLANFWFSSDQVIHCMDHIFKNSSLKKTFCVKPKKYCGCEIAFTEGNFFPLGS